jgi:hypothetical protein
MALLRRRVFRPEILFFVDRRIERVSAVHRPWSAVIEAILSSAATWGIWRFVSLRWAGRVPEPTGSYVPRSDSSMAHGSFAALTDGRRHSVSCATQYCKMGPAWDDTTRIWDAVENIWDAVTSRGPGCFVSIPLHESASNDTPQIESFRAEPWRRMRGASRGRSCCLQHESSREGQRSRGRSQKTSGTAS